MDELIDVDEFCLKQNNASHRQRESWFRAVCKRVDDLEQQLADLTRERDEYNIRWNNALEYNSLYTKQLITRDELIDRAGMLINTYAKSNDEVVQWLADVKRVRGK